MVTSNSAPGRIDGRAVPEGGARVTDSAGPAHLSAGISTNLPLAFELSRLVSKAAKLGANPQNQRPQALFFFFFASVATEEDGMCLDLHVVRGVWELRQMLQSS